MSITFTAAPTGTVQPGSSFTLAWSAVPGAASYTLAIADTTGVFATVAANLTLPTFDWIVPSYLIPADQQTPPNLQTQLGIAAFSGPPVTQLDTGLSMPFTIAAGGAAQLNVATWAPVVYTGTAIDPANPPSTELQLANLPNPPTPHVVAMPGVPSGHQVIAAWYSPYDNIAALSGFATILVAPAGGNQINVSGHGYPGSNTRIRLLVVALWI
jgi:hypothetical protein